MKKQFKIHWLHSKGPEAVFALLMSHERKSICIDTSPVAEAILRIALDLVGLQPVETLRVHLWQVPIADDLHYFFIDDDQNDLVKQGFTSACNI